MEIISTEISNLLIIRQKVFFDERGYFYETYNQKKFGERNLNATFVQDNLSKSSYGVVRGLHFQCGDNAQAKLVSVLSGRVFDVAVDIRPNSPTFGQWRGVELSDENHLQFFIPRGFAHGFSVLSETAIFSYKCDNFYKPKAESGIYLFDKDLKIDWQIPKNKMIISEKDKIHGSLKELKI
jgi:dTDP-4-dehydrorhamnose 3,5-epimerase